jgi:hypothetical protein
MHAHAHAQTLRSTRHGGCGVLCCNTLWCALRSACCAMRHADVAAYIYRLIYQSICLLKTLSGYHLSVYLSIYQYDTLSICLSIYFMFCLSIYDLSTWISPICQSAIFRLVLYPSI